MERRAAVGSHPWWTAPPAQPFGADTVAVEVHDAGHHNGRTLDQDVVTILAIGNGKTSGAAAIFAAELITWAERG